MEVSGFGWASLATHQNVHDLRRSLAMIAMAAVVVV